MARSRSRTEKSASKREQILAAAAEVFSQKGYFRATIDEIIAKADTGKGTVYNYFSNKEELFYILIKEKNAPFLQALEDIAAGECHALEKITAMLRVFLAFYLENADLWRVLMHEMRGLEDEKLAAEGGQGRYRQEFHSGVDILSRTLALGMQEGVIKENDARRMAYALFSVILSMVYQGYARDRADETALAIADAFFNGVAVK